MDRSLRPGDPIHPIAAQRARAAGSVSWLERAFALGLLLLASPLLLAAGLLVLIVDGRPVFYRGERLGLNGRPFTIFKLRTLKTGAEREIRGSLLGQRHDLKTRTGNFLRETRLDELPQLFNVLRGDMALVGPRPERREVVEAQCRGIAGYENRFRVVPGVFGYSQIYTPHSTPKRVRAWLDNRFVEQEHSFIRGLGLLAIAGAALGGEVARRAWRFVSATLIAQRLLGRYVERRRVARVVPSLAVAHLGATADGTPDLTVLDVNEHAFRTFGDRAERLEEGSRVTLRVAPEGGNGFRRARLVVQRSDVRTALDGSREVIVHYAPWSSNSAYVLDQYLLQKSIARVPQRRRSQLAEAA